MRALILFSHGSLLCGAERNLFAIAGSLRSEQAAEIVEVGFLNYTDPLFSVAVDRCVAQGATSIVVLPYFLIAGKFVVEDLASCIATERERHPGVSFTVAPPIGFHERLADAVLASASEAAPEEQWADATQEVFASCRENPRCPLYATPGCRAAEGITA